MGAMKYRGLLPPEARKILQRAAYPKPYEKPMERQIRIEDAIAKVQRQFPEFFQQRYGGTHEREENPGQ